MSSRLRAALVIGSNLLTLICAFFFTFHILVIDYFSPKVDGVKLSCIQFFVTSVISLLFSLIFESTKLSDLIGAWFPILYVGIFSCGVAYTLQIIALCFDVNKTVPNNKHKEVRPSFYFFDVQLIYKRMVF